MLKHQLNICILILIFPPILVKNYLRNRVFKKERKIDKKFSLYSEIKKVG